MRTAFTLLALLAATTSGHTQWTLQTSNTTADLRGIHNVGNGVAWASGTNGTILRTEDSGYVWQSCSIPPGAEKLDFRGIQAFDANTAIVMSSGTGNLSRLYKTTDGCHSWKLIFTNPDTDGFFDAVSAQIPDEFLILGDPVDGQFSHFISTNGGTDWSKTHDPLGLRSDKDEGAFAASNSALLVIDPSQKTSIFGSGGPSGARIFLECVPCDSRGFFARPIPFPKGQSAGVFSIANRDANRLIAVGGDYLKPDEPTGTAACSYDGGKTWSPATTPPHGYRSSVAYDPTTKTWITVGPNGTDISTDDGKNWRALHPDPALHESPDADRSWNALSLPFVVGPHGRIGKLEDAALKH